MPRTKKVHCFEDCGANMGAGDRSTGHLTPNVEQVTCGTCKQRIVQVLLDADWSRLSLREVAFVSALKNSV